MSSHMSSNDHLDPSGHSADFIATLTLVRSSLSTFRSDLETLRELKKQGKDSK